MRRRGWTNWLIITVGFLLLTKQDLFCQESSSSSKWQELTGVEVQKISETKCNVVVALTGPVKFYCFRVTNPPRLVLEMVNTLHNWKAKEVEVGGSLLRRVRSGQYQNEPIKIARVVLDLEKPVDYETTVTERQIILTISARNEEKRKEGLEKKGEKTATTQVRETVVKKPVLQPNVQDLEHRRLIEKIRKEEQEEKVAVYPQKGKTGTPVGEVIGPISQEPVSIDFVDADISEVVRFFALKTGINFVLAEGVQGRITVHLRNVPFDEAIRTILDQKGLIPIQYSENVVKIVEKSKMPIHRKVFVLKNRSAHEVKETIDKSLTEEEKKYTLVGLADVTNGLVVTSTAEGVERLSRLIQELDVKKPQIKISAKIMEVDITKGIDLGIDWTVSKTFTGGGAFGDTTLTGNVEDMTSPFSYGTPGTLNIATIMSGAELELTLKALQKKTQTRTLSTPTLVVESNRPAHIHVGDTIPYKMTIVTEGGATETMGQLEIGTTLDVTPTVSPTGDQISMEVNVAVKDFVGYTDAGPQTTDREASTKVTIKEGQTVVVGGLVSQTEKGTAYQVPLLGDIPILGYLFKKKETQKRTLELLIFLTPFVVRD